MLVMRKDAAPESKEVEAAKITSKHQCLYFHLGRNMKDSLPVGNRLVGREACAVGEVLEDPPPEELPAAADN